MDDSQAILPEFGADKPTLVRVADKIFKYVAIGQAKPLVWRLLMSLLMVILAIVVREVFLDALDERLVYITFDPAVAMAALLGGIAAGVLATVLAGLLAHVLIAPLQNSADLLGLAAFLASSFLIVVMAETVCIAQRRLAENVRSGQQAERMRSFVERVPVAIAMFDTNMRYLASSARWRSNFKIEDDVIGRSHYDVFPEISEHWRQVHRRALAGEGRRANLELSTRPDGSQQWLRWEVQPWYRGDSTIGGITIFSEDLTEQKLLEEQLVQAQKMEIVGNLSGGVAHDFNNLLTVILGNAELLEDELLSRHEISQIAENIGQAAERGAALTRQLLAFGRRQMLRPVTVDCNALLTGLQRLLRPALRADIEIRTDFDPSLCAAFADPVELEAAVLNLVLNSQDAMPAGGRVTITTSVAQLDHHSLHPDVRPGRYVVIAVTDTGEGIPQDLLAKVFEPFFTTKDVGKGSGLGLSMVYGFAKQSDGHVSIYSEASLGTTVRIYLPEAQSGATAWPDPTETEALALPVGTETVLVVEDDALVTSYLVTSLTSLGYSVVAARDGSEALQKLRSEITIDLLFTDIIMPGRLKGWKLAELARECRPGLPVVLTSGYALETLVDRGSTAAELVVLTKPYRKSELAHCLRRVLNTASGATMMPAQ